MKAVRVDRGAVDRSAPRGANLRGLILTADLRDRDGRIAIAKGTLLDDGVVDRMESLEWSEIHLLEPEPGELLEGAAGIRIAAAAAGPLVTARPMSGGHWPLVADVRGILEVHDVALRAVNGIEGLAVYTLFDGQVIDAEEVVGRAKIVPFVIAESAIAGAEQLALEAGGLVRINPFTATRLGAIVIESLGDRALTRFQDAMREKAAWFGSTLLPARVVAQDAPGIASAITETIAAGARILVVAGSRPMDPLDSAFAALATLGARIVRRGAPAHPGSLLWLATLGPTQIVGMPACGLFSQATVFDLLLPRLLAGLRVDAEWIAGLGQGGLLTRDMSYRFPPYRTARERGEVT